MKKVIINLFAVIIISGANFVFAQTKTTTDSFNVNLRNNYKISQINIIPFSETVFLSGRQLEKNNYQIDYKTGYFQLNDSLKYSFPGTLVINYNSIILNIEKEYKHRSLEIRLDEFSLDTLRVTKATNVVYNSESLFGKDLQKSGALIRGFTVGTNRDFTLNSGLRLQLSGKLSEEISLVAALSDENTPIQPEGNTETLDELDKVFIELRHKNGAATFGDYDFNLSRSEFSQVTRKLQGLMGQAQYEKSNATIALAGSKGKFNSNSISGQEGNQGPYRLTGVNNEREIIIIAGSERVFLDGMEMKRGENNDYVIDYSNAEVTFTPKRLITSASRIIVEFEYSDQKFKRNFFGVDFSTSIFTDKLKFGVSYLREGDDENSPIDFSYTDEQLNILKNAGDNRNKAFISGVSIAAIDSLGKQQGTYLKRDTTINSTLFSYYIYSPGSIEAIYNVSFTYVGAGNGDYTKESLGKYKFAGINQGSYSPIVFIPMPELKQLGNFSINFNAAEGINFSGELSASSYDRNKLSSIDDSGNFGYARKIFFEIQPREVSLSNIKLGKIGFSYKDRFIQSKYTTLDRIDNVEFNRDYNITSSNGDQVLREAQLFISPFENLKMNTKYGYLKQGDDFKSNRFNTQIDIDFPKTFVTNYNLDYVQTTNVLSESKWLKQNGKMGFIWDKLSTGAEFLHEDKKDNLINSDSLLTNSLRYFEVGPFIKLADFYNFDAKVNFGFRTESFPLNGILKEQSTAVTRQLEINYRGIKEFSSSLNLTFRNKKITDDFKNALLNDNETILIQSQSRFNFFNNAVNGDLYYQAATEQTARLEKVFVKVQKGTGNYIYLGDLNGNGIPEENEFQLSLYDADFILVTIPTDKLYPVIDLKTNTRWKIDFARLVSSDAFVSKMIKAVSTETNFRIEEKSKDEITRHIYLLNLDKFLSETNTLQGSQIFLQDINILQNNSELSFRLRFNQKRNLTQYSGGVERGYSKERSLRIRFKMVEEISNQTDITNSIDNMISPISTGRARQITSNGFSSDFSYRPYKQIEVGFKLEASRSLDKYPIKPQTIDVNSFTLRSTYSFENTGRLRLEVERTELSTSSSEYSIPYEILKGNVIGKNYFFRVFFDYRLTSFVQTSFSYDARLQGSSKLIQTMRAEARAYF